MNNHNVPEKIGQLKILIWYYNLGGWAMKNTIGLGRARGLVTGGAVLLVSDASDVRTINIPMLCETASVLIA